MDASLLYGKGGNCNSSASKWLGSNPGFRLSAAHKLRSRIPEVKSRMTATAISAITRVPRSVWPIRLAPEPVSFYALVFFLVNATYLALIWELVPEDALQRHVRRNLRQRAVATLCLFAIAAFVALLHPIWGLGICVFCLIGYLRPGPG